MPFKIYFEDESRMVGESDELFKKYTLVRAAGGLVMNDEGQLLMIFRRGKWDLPKGKFEDGETIEECAKREVEEETGLTEIGLKKPLHISYHTYGEKKGFFLKETHWFLFDAPGNQPLIPQMEEDISQIEWVHPDDLATYTNNTYGLIRDVLEAAGYTIDASEF